MRVKILSFMAMLGVLAALFTGQITQAEPAAAQSFSIVMNLPSNNCWYVSNNATDWDYDCGWRAGPGCSYNVHFVHRTDGYIQTRIWEQYNNTGGNCANNFIYESWVKDHTIPVVELSSTRIKVGYSANVDSSRPGGIVYSHTLASQPNTLALMQNSPYQWAAKHSGVSGQPQYNPLTGQFNGWTNFTWGSNLAIQSVWNVGGGQYHVEDTGMWRHYYPNTFAYAPLIISWT